MTIELLTGLVLFSFVASVTPGPNNLMLMASGANYGFRRTIPHMLGVGIGFVGMTLIVGAGLAQVFDRYPVSYTILKVVSLVYMVYLAVRIAFAAPFHSGRLGSSGDSDVVPKGNPITFIQAVLFQWVNPKAWAMALTAMSVYLPTRSLGGVVLVASIFGAINLPTVSLWTLLGQQIRHWLTSSLHLRIFNVFMALMLLVSLLPVLFL
ncbi:MAG: hypothetical protein RLZZ385_291 [Pseudomonadota bacterium]|jgi:threonine/homoserine/homoserine lactone efflux protein